MSKITEELRAYFAEIGRKGGKIGGKAKRGLKAKTARENGKKGGRPKASSKKKRK